MDEALHLRLSAEEQKHRMAAAGKGSIPDGQQYESPTDAVRVH